eukprot:99792_1
MGSDFSKKILDFVYGVCLNHPFIVMGVWIIGALSGAYFGMDLPNYCIFSFDPPSGSPSYDSYNKITKYFPDFVFKDYEIIVIETGNEVNVINKDTEKLLIEINETLWNKINTNYNILDSFSTYFDIYISESDPIYPLYKQKFVNPSNNTMICFISININNIEQDIINGFINELISKLSTYNNHYGSTDYTMLSLTGAMTMWDQGMTQIQNDMTTKDMMMTPFIFVLMMYVIGSYKFIFIIVPILIMSVSISMSSFVPFAKYNILKLNPLVPSLMLFLCLALSVDYSMFLLSRFTSEIKKGSSVPDAVHEMIRYSAHVVVLSGMVLIVSYIGVAFIPFAGMDSLGYGAIFTIFFSVIINITFTSSVLLAFPKYFGELRCKMCCKRCRDKQTQGTYYLNNFEPKNALLPVPDDSSLQVTTYDPINDNMISQSHPSHPSMYIRTHKDHKNAQNWYFILTSITTTSPWNYIIPIIIYIAMSPAIYILFTQYKYSMDFTAYFPTDSSSVKAYKQMMISFPAGDLWPYYILGITNNKTNPYQQIWTDQFFQSFCYSTQTILNNGYNIPADQFHSVMYSPNITVNISSNGTIINYNISNNEIFCFNQHYEYNNKSYSMVNEIEFIYQNGTNYINKTDPYYMYYEYINLFMETLISDSQTASLISFIPSFNPLLQSAVQPSRDMRSLIDNINKNETWSNITKLYIHNSLYWQIDSLDETYDRMPYMMGIIIVIIFILIGIMFKAYFLPLRLFFVIIIPIAFVYGIAVGIYVIGWLDWLNWNSLHSTDGIVWMIPCISITILMGLAMDYEIFLFSRIIEYRYKGYSTRAAIILGCANTGPIISSAG